MAMTLFQVFSLRVYRKVVAIVSEALSSSTGLLSSSTARAAKGWVWASKVLFLWFRKIFMANIATKQKFVSPNLRLGLGMVGVGDPHST